jgi:hypothetical protein
MIFNTKAEGRRGDARHKLRWLDYVEDDINILGIKICRLKAQDRKYWTIILREVEVKLKGP